MQLQPIMQSEKNKHKVLQKMRHKMHSGKMQVNFQHVYDHKKVVSIVNPRFWRKKTAKKNAYLLTKLKVLEKQSQKKLHWASKSAYISELVPVLTLFAKYLDPQPLADTLAKVIGTTKKHAEALKTVEAVMRTLNLKRGIGYRISLMGRINGANKSRAIYLKKFKRNRPRQTFSRKVNFAMAQARAQIGAFGIKIWIYQ